MILLFFLLPLLPFALLLFGMLVWQLFWPVLLIIFVIWLLCGLGRRRE